jgi:hypothetical protein
VCEQPIPDRHTPDVHWWHEPDCMNHLVHQGADCDCAGYVHATCCGCAEADSEGGRSSTGLWCVVPEQETTEP